MARGLDPTLAEDYGLTDGNSGRQGMAGGPVSRGVRNNQRANYRLTSEKGEEPDRAKARRSLWNADCLNDYTVERRDRAASDNRGRVGPAKVGTSPVFGSQCRFPTVHPASRRADLETAKRYESIDRDPRGSSGGQNHHHGQRQPSRVQPRGGPCGLARGRSRLIDYPLAKGPEVLKAHGPEAVRFGPLQQNRIR